MTQEYVGTRGARTHGWFQNDFCRDYFCFYSAGVSVLSHKKTKTFAELSELVKIEKNCSEFAWVWSADSRMPPNVPHQHEKDASVVAKLSGITAAIRNVLHILL